MARAGKVQEGNITYAFQSFSTSTNQSEYVWCRWSSFLGIYKSHPVRLKQITWYSLSAAGVFVFVKGHNNNDILEGSTNMGMYYLPQASIHKFGFYVVSKKTKSTLSLRRMGSITSSLVTASDDFRLSGWNILVRRPHPTPHPIPCQPEHPHHASPTETMLSLMEGSTQHGLPIWVCVYFW